MELSEIFSQLFCNFKTAPQTSINKIKVNSSKQAEMSSVLPANPSHTALGLEHPPPVIPAGAAGSLQSS